METHKSKKDERENWIINIEYIASEIASYEGPDLVAWVLEKYGARSIEDIKSSDLQNVFNELTAIKAGLN